MSEAVGIHDHDTLKTGLRDPDPEKADKVIKFSAIRSGDVVSRPIIPTAVDDTTGVVYGLDHNDEFGVCVPTGFDNFRRTISLLFTGTQISASWDQIVAWYREQNPKFNPDLKPNDPEQQDGGCDIQTFLEARVAAGDIVAFAAVNPHDDKEVREAVYLFLGIILGVSLQTAQQEQTSETPPIWDYEESGVWGGHCIMEPAFLADKNDEAISWAMKVQMTPAFIRRQRSQAFVCVTEAHLQHPDFRAGIDLAALASEYERLTHTTLQLPPIAGTLN